MIREGRGWRLGYSGATPYGALIGGEVWAFELREEEWQDLITLLDRVWATIGQLEGELSDQERFSFTIDSEWWELESGGLVEDWQLRLQTRSGRRAEGFWDCLAVAEVREQFRCGFDPVP